MVDSTNIVKMYEIVKNDSDAVVRDFFESQNKGIVERQNFMVDFFIHCCKTDSAKEFSRLSDMTKYSRHGGFYLQRRIKQIQALLLESDSALMTLYIIDKVVNHHSFNSTEAYRFKEELFSMACKAGCENIVNSMIDNAQRIGDLREWLFLKGSQENKAYTNISLGKTKAQLKALSIAPVGFCQQVLISSSLNYLAVDSCGVRLLPQIFYECERIDGEKKKSFFPISFRKKIITQELVETMFLNAIQKMFLSASAPQDNETIKFFIVELDLNLTDNIRKNIENNFFLKKLDKKIHALFENKEQIMKEQQMINKALDDKAKTLANKDDLSNEAHNTRNPKVSLKPVSPAKFKI